MNARVDMPQVRDLAPSVLFPAAAPAGWSWTDHGGLRSGFAPDPFASAFELFADSQRNLRALAAKLLGDGIDLGLTASETTDVIVRDEGYIRARARFIEHYERIPPQRAPSSARKTFDPRLWALDPKLGRNLESATRAEFMTCVGLNRLAESTNAQPIPTSVDEEKRRGDPLWFLSDALLSDRVVRGMLASHRGYAMAAALDGLVHEQFWRLRLITEAARIWADESRRYLTLIASLPDAGIPLTVVPLASRLDLSGEIAEQCALVAELRGITA